MSKKKVLFIDRDDTLIVEPADEQIDSLEKLEFYPGVFTWLGKIARELNFELVMVTNQDGLGTQRFPEETFWPAHNKMMRALENEGIRFADVLIDRSMPEDKAPTRKPGIGLLKKYLNEDVFDFKASFTIGDRLTDIELAKNLGAKGILLDKSFGALLDTRPDLKAYCSKATDTWEEVYRYLSGASRSASINRTTKETKIQGSLSLGGGGNSEIKTGLAFFDHMLDQLARHGELNIQLQVNGDLHVDEHHTIEDTAIALGEAFNAALGDKRGIERYGFCLPMDDCIAQVAIDFGGRPWLEWNADFKREKIGDMPTEMFIHFFKSFSDNAKCNLYVKAEGVNEHHKIESIFKAFAKAIKMAVKKDGSELPTTKGIL